MLQVVATHAGRLRRGAPRPETRSPAAHSDLPLGPGRAVPSSRKLPSCVPSSVSGPPNLPVTTHDPRRRRGRADDTRGRRLRCRPGLLESSPGGDHGRPTGGLRVSGAVALTAEVFQTQGGDCARPGPQKIWLVRGCGQGAQPATRAGRRPNGSTSRLLPCATRFFIPRRRRGCSLEAGDR